ncbi:MAG: MoxR family ATPase [Bacteroidia bacterium]|nr:MoxR family ATPase [Bacteroidia bacterium]
MENKNIQNIAYIGVALQEPQSFDWADLNGKPPKRETITPYIPNSEIREAVALMRILKRPLLLKGEPGCGKTRLAKAVAFELYGAAYHNYYFEWNIKSTSKARDGLFTYDYVGELRDAQMREPEELKKSPKTLAEKKEAKKNYREFGPLGKAFQASTKEHPAILLIDEVDKADIDFPNDLLLELDQLRFAIDETGEEIEAGYPPMIFITSNDEKELPKAFLRRCLFHFVEFPGLPILQTIVRSNFPFLAENLVQAAVKRFDTLREDMKKELNTEKKVSTSELIDWVRVVNFYFLEEILGDLEEKIKEKNITPSEKLPEMITELLRGEIPEKERYSMQQALAEAIDGLDPSDAEFPRKLVATLAEDRVTQLVEKLEKGHILHHHALIKSYTDYQLHVAKAKTLTGTR